MDKPVKHCAPRLPVVIHCHGMQFSLSRDLQVRECLAWGGRDGAERVVVSLTSEAWIVWNQIYCVNRQPMNVLKVLEVIVPYAYMPRKLVLAMR
jgi:hypothetical protein